MALIIDLHIDDWVEPGRYVLITAFGQITTGKQRTAGTTEGEDRPPSGTLMIVAMQLLIMLPWK